MRPYRGHCPFSEDLIAEILLRLLVKPLLRFKSVCKLWRTIITRPCFIRNHFRRESNSTGLLVYREGESLIYGPELDHVRTLDIGQYDNEGLSDVYAFTLFPDEAMERRELVYHGDLIGPFLEMHGPCNGVFCLLRADFTLVLWNPLTRRSRLVPPPPYEGLHFQDFVHDFGCGMDPSTDDLKIVLFDGDFRKPDFVVYSLTNNSWRSFREEALVDPGARLKSTYFNPAISNGFSHWVKYNSNTSHYVILAFDMHNELFQEIGMPEITPEDIDIPVRSSVQLQLHWYGDSLALSTCVCYFGKTHFDIWLMKEQGCWTKISAFSLPFDTYTVTLVSNQMFAVTLDWKLMIYDINSGNRKYIEFQRIDDVYGDFLAPFPYKGSIVPV